MIKQRFKKLFRTEMLVAIGLIAFGVALRFLPHPANVAPIAAVALFSGVYLPKRYAIIVPLAAMIVSDLFIGLHDLILFTWGSFALVGVIGWYVRKRKNVLSVVAGSLAGSMLFYLITNFAVWAFSELYVKTPDGLVQSYYFAIPFFRNTLLGDLFYVGVLFGLYEFVLALIRRRQSATGTIQVN